MWYNSAAKPTSKEHTRDAKKTGELIAQCRKARGMSQGELASRLHVTDKAVSKWETGRGMPGIDTLEPLDSGEGAAVPVP